MARPLTYNDALRRVMRGQRVPYRVYRALEHARFFAWCRDRRVLTHLGRGFLRSGVRLEVSA